ncbi:hypothetical protein SteCoe_12010 [Stentor coeruleus]|uniref:Cyclin N-terminal domain-containing protein n=1 Tax=Stentor coeruleus TaxID=5963 RepID=A0A1R2CBQ1_9CILI|nr:hypothetical protein SteCoe_12010 [Stentor coeruleus]
MSIAAGFASEILKHVKLNDGRKEFQSWAHNFNLIKPMPMKLENFVEHFLYQMNSEEDLLVYAFIILEKAYEEMTLFNVHRLVFTALAISYKFCTDCPATNIQIEKVGGFKPGELMTLETVLLDVCQWKINYLHYDDTENYLLEAGKIEIALRKEQDIDEFGDLYDVEDGEMTTCETNESFSELSAFFTF